MNTAKTNPLSFREYTPTEYLMIDIATNYGDTDINGETVDLDKVNFEDRIQWFKEQEKAGTLAALISSADKPALYFAGLAAYRDHLDGKAIGYPVSLDACSSGLQILAVLANCEKSARKCGVVSTGNREDAYTGLFMDMKRYGAGMDLKASRKSLKQAVMTSLYGSMAQPRQLFGDGTPALALFYEVMEKEIPGAWALNLALKSLWQPYNLSHSWTLPDGFEVQMDVEELDQNEVIFMNQAVSIFTKENKGTPKGLSLSPNIVHSIDGMIVREIVRRCNHDARHVADLLGMCDVALARQTRRSSTSGRGRPKDELLKKLWDLYLKTKFLSARVIDLVDENNISMISASKLKELLLSLPVKPFSVLTIHDCFRVHPNYGNDLRRQYNYILSDLAKSDVLAHIATEVTGRRKSLTKVGNISEKIKHANYALS